MTDRLLELVERLEAATGPDRKLDVAIAKALGLPHGRETGWCNNENGDYWVVDECAKPFTASLDDALDLVPDGWSFNLGNDTQPWAMLWIDMPSYDGVPYRGHAATPALALCAAALRAIATQQDAAKGDRE